MTPDMQPGGGGIVAGVDGSPTSLEALAWAVRQAELTGSMLHIVMTWEWPPTYAWAVPIPDDWDPEEEMHKSLSAIAAEVRTEHPELVFDASLVEGHPVPNLIEASKGADLLVVGCRGHSEFVGMLLGSVSENCAMNAHCPVLVYRPRNADLEGRQASITS